ncbi:MAG: glycosyltransferase family 4 protein [Chloroflexi bacterium]|nr:glycosyltransferase family 4 protein [Chloroflexota bacterium]
MRIAIDAQLQPTGQWGGVEQFVLGLVHALGKLDDGAEKYVIVGHWENVDWLKLHIGPNQQLIQAPRPSPLASTKEWLGPLRAPAGRLMRRVRYLARRAVGLPVPVMLEPNRFYESLGVAIVHFPFQIFSYTRTPFIYNPHDLQHLHYPQFFPREDIAARESSWPLACRLAQAVVTDSRWVKEDVAQQYSIAPEKIFSIPMGPPTELYGALTDVDLANTRACFQLPETFAFYPAQTWQHKNHLRLIEAIALLRDRDHLVLNLVCTGKQNEFYRVVDQRVRELRLETQVRFLGFIEPTDLRALYHLAQFVIHPSLFEGGGLPILEAFREGAPVACSNTTSLPEYADDAASYFDPASVESIAEAAKRMITDEKLRASLRTRGRVRVQSFTWERTAKMYRALYRKVIGMSLSDEERHLLENS